MDDRGGAPYRSFLRSLLVVGGAAVLVILLFLLVLIRGSSGVDEALAILRDDGRFPTASEAAGAFALAGSRLMDEGAECSRRGGRDHPRCAALLEASGYAQVAAVAVARCTAPGIYDARQTMIAYLVELEADKAVYPQPPGVPRC